MAKCSHCGAYVDPFEWPSDMIQFYRPNLCFECYKAECSSEEDEEEEAKNFDPNTEYGMSEVKPDPDDDDTPDLGSSSDNENPEMEESNDGNESEPLSDEMQSIRDIQRMLFG